MTAKYAVLRQSVVDTGITQDFTDSSFSDDVKLAVAFWSGTQTSDDSTVANAVMGMGLTDGQTQFCVGAWSADNQASVVSRRGRFTDRFIQTHDGSLGERDRATATFLQDGIRLTWQSAVNRTLSRLTVILIGGQDVTAEVLELALDSAVDTAATATFSNVTLDDADRCCVLSWLVDITSNDLWIDDMSISHGVVVNDGSDSQACVGVLDVSGSAAGDNAVYYGNNRMGASVGAAAVNYTLEADSFTSTGLDITTRDGAPGTGKSVFLAAINVGNSGRVGLSQFTTPAAGTAPFTTDYTGLGFTANLGVIFCGTDSVANGYVDGANCSMSVSAWDDTVTGGVSLASEHAADPTNTNSYVADDIIVVDALGNVDNRGERDGTQHADGFTVNWTTRADANARKVWALALGDVTVGSSTGVRGHIGQIAASMGIQGFSG